MSPLPLVTIMIPTFRQASVLCKAVDSALAQTYEHLEIVICDDHSPDDTISVLERYEKYPHVRVYRNEENLGRVRNYKHILEDLAAGDWALNLDGDDYLTDDSFIATAIQQILQSQRNIVFVQAGHIVATPDQQTIREDLPRIAETTEIIDGKNYFLHFHHFSHLATLFDRKLALSMDFYRFDILSTDIESFLRLALHGEVMLMKKPVGVWVHHDANESRKLTIDAIERNMLRIDGPYQYALELNTIPARTLRRWQTKMKKKYLANYLTVYFRKTALIPGYFSHIFNHYPLQLTGLPFSVALARGMKWRLARIFHKKSA